ncbi:hypothetical protein [Methanosarcina sp.]|uniref:hypothetical protein n=1 Tax=Methanosarcina sp. TaxID=2213 RepID=UPI002ABC79DE|nr:hypothetical protein [Methanosarcina sp.]MDY9926613.1 hypothetical protein [Methanosarcina sp.]
MKIVIWKLLSEKRPLFDEPEILLEKGRGERFLKSRRKKLQEINRKILERVRRI